MLFDSSIFNTLKENLAIILLAFISFAVFVWASKRLLDFLGLDNLGLRIEAKKQIKKEDRQKKIREYKSEYRKIEAKKKRYKSSKKAEKKALKNYLVSQKLKSKQEKKQRAENGRVIARQKRKADFERIRLKAENAPLIQRIPKAKISKISNSKRTNRKDFMSKKYRETNFNNPLTNSFNPPKFENSSRDFNGWKSKELNDFSKKIQADRNYKSHSVLNGGSASYMVRTKNNEWFYHGYISDGKSKEWKKLTEIEAKNTFNNHNKGYLYNEMK